MTNSSIGLIDDWKKNALGVINKILKEPLKLQVKNVIGGGEQDWAVLELAANGVCKNGMEYPQRYAWFLHFNDKGIIYEVYSSPKSVRLVDLRLKLSTRMG